METCYSPDRFGYYQTNVSYRKNALNVVQFTRVNEIPSEGNFLLTLAQEGKLKPEDTEWFVAHLDGLVMYATKEFIEEVQMHVLSTRVKIEIKGEHNVSTQPNATPRRRRTREFASHDKH